MTAPERAEIGEINFASTFGFSKIQSTSVSSGKNWTLRMVETDANQNPLKPRPRLPEWLRIKLPPRIHIEIDRTKLDSPRASDRDVESHAMKFIVFLAEPIKAREQNLTRRRSRFCPGIAKPAGEFPSVHTQVQRTPHADLPLGNPPRVYFDESLRHSSLSTC